MFPRIPSRVRVRPCRSSRRPSRAFIKIKRRGRFKFTSEPERSLKVHSNTKPWDVFESICFVTKKSTTREWQKEMYADSGRPTHGLGRVEDDFGLRWLRGANRRKWEGGLGNL